MAVSLPSLGRRAVIAGGSLAGLLAARAVADHFDEVLILDRDEIADDAEPRRLTPQSHHVHMLLKGGENAIERMLPGFREAIETCGSVSMQAGQEFVAGSDLGLAPRWNAEMILHAQSRPMLEQCVRRLALGYSDRITQQTGVTVRGVRYDADANRITGVHVESDGNSSEMEADLVVDASGRGAAGIRWLAAAGAPLPDIEEVEVDFGYASAVFELADEPRDWVAFICGNLPRVGARGGVLLPMEGDRYICSLGGRAGDYPPTDLEGFLEFARSLPQPQIHDALSRAELKSEIHQLLYPANRFRHYERMDNLPAGIVPLGDALCSFNPTYGQGMSSAAMQAGVLYDTLATRTVEDDIGSLMRTHLVAAADVADHPWRNANYADSHYPSTRGVREDMFTEEDRQYRLAVQVAGSRDEYVRRVAMEVAHLLAPHERLYEDDVRERVLAATAA